MLDNRFNNIRLKFLLACGGNGGIIRKKKRPPSTAAFSTNYHLSTIN